MSEVKELWYWYTQGLVQPARYMLKAKNIQFTEKLFDGDTIKSEWHVTDKPAMAKINEFANLPLLVLKDGTAITQSRAVILYVAETCGFEGKNLMQRVNSETLAGVMLDLFMIKFFKLMTGGDYANVKYVFNKDLVAMMNQLESFSKKHKFLTGETLTYADFMWFQMLNIFRRYSKEVSQIEWIPKYLESVRVEAGEDFRAYDQYTNDNIHLLPSAFNWPWGANVPNKLEIGCEGFEAPCILEKIWQKVGKLDQCSFKIL